MYGCNAAMHLRTGSIESDHPLVEKIIRAYEMNGKQ